jgi:phosphonate transport system substrate-binding protein
MTQRLVFFLLLTLAALTGCDRVGDQPALKIAYMNCNNERETRERFAPLSRYLSEKVGVDFETITVDTHEFEDRMRAGEFALTHTNSLLYVILKEAVGLKLLAAEKRGAFGSYTAGALIAKKGSGIEKLEDIKGKRLIFGPMLAPSGYLAQYDLMLKAGIDPERDLAYYAIPAGAFKHEKLIYAVYFGDFDVAAAPVLDLEEMTRDGKITADDFVILAQSQIFPYCTFGAAADLDPKLFARNKQALLELTSEDTVEIDGERVKVLKTSWAEGFEDLLDSDYDQLRDMARRANMPPYQSY